MTWQQNCRNPYVEFNYNAATNPVGMTGKRINRSQADFKKTELSNSGAHAENTNQKKKN